MGIFDFFRKKKSAEFAAEKVHSSEIGNWINVKIRNIDKKNKEIFLLIREKVGVLEQEMKGKIIAAEEINIEKKKSDERIKAVVEEGRNKYVEFVKNLLDDLRNLKEKEFEKSIEEINKIFSDFNKKAHMSYERATILIGKEMSSIRDSLKSFSKEILGIFNENKNIIDSLNIIRNVQLKLKQKEDFESDITRINELISFLESEISEKENESEKILSEIERIKKSPEHSEHLNRQEKLKLLKKDLNENFNELRQFIDFKALAKFHHIFENEMKIINLHMSKFQQTFENDNGESIICLLDSANLNNKDIFDKISEINKKKKEMLEYGNSEDKPADLHSKNEKVILEINELKKSREKEEKRLDKVNENKESIIKGIEEELSKIGVELIK